jgi:hypothetical protein
MMRIFWIRLIFLISLTGSFGIAQAMTSLEDAELGKVTGQALLVAENIQGTGTWSDYTYTRMGLDAKLSLNANIDRWQMGCGGFNETIRTGCDIDMDYVRFMGRSGTGPCQGADLTNTASACYGGGDLSLTRPYVEIATKGSGSQRELVGIKIGAQLADGYFGVGRNYTNGQVNQENGGTCGTSAGAAALACHSGINSISGFLRAEMSAQVDTTVAGIFQEVACFGNTRIGGDNCGVADTYYKDLVGTRMQNISAPSTALKLSGGFLSAIGISTAYANLTENFRFIHGFALEATQDFGISFQRQKIAYPNYNKTTYSYPANAGWWMNVPDVKAVDIVGAPVSIGLFDVGSALGEPGLPLTNIELNSVAPKNCWGSSMFC